MQDGSVVLTVVFAHTFSHKLSYILIYYKEVVVKLFAGILCALLLTIFGTTEEAQAYFLTNNTPVPVNGVIVMTTCGPMGPFSIPPMTTIMVNPPLGCTVTGIRYRGVPYGFTPGFVPIPPPNPPFAVWVTPNGATFN